MIIPYRFEHSGIHYDIYPVNEILKFKNEKTIKVLLNRVIESLTFISERIDNYIKDCSTVIEFNNVNIDHYKKRKTLFTELISCVLFINGDIDVVSISEIKQIKELLDKLTDDYWKLFYLKLEINE